MIGNTENLLQWYYKAGRELPWRNTRNPYKIWLSEIILQQTRIEQGLAYYHKFVNQYPDVFKLAAAPLKDILNLWQGLGYYTRATNLHRAARMVVDEYMGVFPENYRTLLKLPGVGMYTAAAIASIAFNEKVPAIDGNVKRVVSRLYAINEPVDERETLKMISRYASDLIDDETPGDFNQALMELGARLCKPRNPLCNECPFMASCVALSKNIQKKIPFKKRKVKVRKRYFNYFVFIYQGHTILKERRDNDIWKNLYEFPLIETENAVTQTGKLIDMACKTWNWEPDEVQNVAFRGPYKHILTHQVIEAVFVIINLHSPLLVVGFSVDSATLINYPVSRLTEKFLNNEENLL